MHGCVGSEQARRINKTYFSNAPLFFREVKKKGRMWSGNYRQLYTKSEQDWLHLMQKGTISSRKHRRISVPDDNIRECVSLIFLPTNRKLLATGSKKVKMEDGEVIELPAVRRKKSRLHIFNDYLAIKKVNNAVRAIGRTSFMDMVRVITSGRQKMKQCVAYFCEVLLFENIRTVNYIIDKLVNDVHIWDELKAQLEAVTDFLKHGYISHLDKGGYGAHDTISGLVGSKTVARWKAMCDGDVEAAEMRLENTVSVIPCDGLDWAEMGILCHYQKHGLLQR